MAQPTAQPPTDDPTTVTLVMEQVQPYLDNVLKYVLAICQRHYLPPSVYHRADLSTERNRVALVTYALHYASECALDALADLPVDTEWDPDEFPDQMDLWPASKRYQPAPRSRTGRSLRTEAGRVT